MHTNRIDTNQRTVKPTNPLLRSRLAEYRTNEGLSNPALGLQIGYSGTQVSNYLNDSFRGDVEKFESNVEDILRTAPIRKLVDVETFETGVTSAIGEAIAVILKTNDFGVIPGPAGIGKSVSAARFVTANPTAILVTLWQDCCNAHYIQKQLFADLGSRGFTKSGLNRTEWIFSRLKGSNRLIIIDNGHRATKAARKFLFDLHDKTGCPVVMLGNPEILEAIKQNDQEYSRVGFCPPDIGLDQKELPAISAMILEQMCPKLATELMPYAIRVAGQRGHLRALRKQIKLALEFMSRGERDARAAFRAAHTQLVRNYDLE